MHMDYFHPSCFERHLLSQRFMICCIRWMRFDNYWEKEGIWHWFIVVLAFHFLLLESIFEYSQQMHIDYFHPSCSEGHSACQFTFVMFLLLKDFTCMLIANHIAPVY